MSQQPPTCCSLIILRTYFMLFILWISRSTGPMHHHLCSWHPQRASCLDAHSNKVLKACLNANYASVTGWNEYLKYDHLTFKCSRMCLWNKHMQLGHDWYSRWEHWRCWMMGSGENTFCVLIWSHHVKNYWLPEQHVIPCTSSSGAHTAGFPIADRHRSGRLRSIPVCDFKLTLQLFVVLLTATAVTSD